MYTLSSLLLNNLEHRRVTMQNFERANIETVLCFHFGVYLGNLTINGINEAYIAK